MRNFEPIQIIKEILISGYPDYVNLCIKDGLKPVSFRQYCQYVFEGYVDEICDEMKKRQAS